MNRRMTMATVVVAAGSLMTAGLMLRDAYASGGTTAFLTLTSLREVRLRELVKPAEDQMTFPGQEPGLVLSFSFEGPDGKKLIAVQEPMSITAVDSTGRSLTDLPKPQWGEPSHIEMGMSFDETPPQEFSLRLAVSDR
ncbi:MAG: hypothetical protein GY953_46300, partial [bacterium]|nr:hypothetical protein [bacterium]